MAAPNADRIAVVITTIQRPTPGITRIAEGIERLGGPLVLVGDRKTPHDFGCPGAITVPFEEQLAGDFATARAVPADSYTRKLVGYLHAMETGAAWIRETDDDNAPYEAFFDAVPAFLEVRLPQETSGWVNPYAYFADAHVWPRGFPLDAVAASMPRDAVRAERELPGELVVLQALADGDPDVDAVYRLVSPDRQPIRFRDEAPLLLPSGCWAPFNSQATTWPRALFPLLYLPATCSFRMTDIWRSFIAQRVFRECGASLVFTAPTVLQERNEHDLMRDFRDEIEGYVGYRSLVEVLDGISLVGGIGNLLDDLASLIEAMVAAGFLSEAELPIVEAWSRDLRSMGVAT